MKKKTILLGAALAALSFLAVKKHQQKTEQLWFTLEHILVNEELRMISGECTEGSYLGEMEVYPIDSVDLSFLENGMSIRVLGGPGMTLSLPPQLMNCTKIEILKQKAE